MDLSALPALDQHAHPVLRAEAADVLPYARAFTEAEDAAQVEAHAPHTLCYQRSLRDVAELLDCAPTEEAIVAGRKSLSLEEWTRRCLAAARLEEVLLDDGYLADDSLPLAWHRRFVPVRRLLRLETLAQELFAAATDFAAFEERYRGALAGLTDEVAGLKSIAAYRCGLALAPVERADAGARYEALKRAVGEAPLRLVDPVLIAWLVTTALEVAARRDLPVQFHTGFGDPDLDLRLANPLHLRPLFEDQRYRAPVVLLHASYPFQREAGYLASVYPHVHVDVGLAVPLLSVAGMRDAVRGLLELAPVSKVLYSSDAHLLPETFYLGAKWGRRVLGEVLARAVADGDLSAAEADRAAEAVLAGNARRLYGCAQVS